MAEIFEIAMILLFGISWPMNVMKSIKTKTTKGKSIVFLWLILVGYIAGITSKFVNPVYMASFATKWYVLIFYFFNLIMVITDTVLFYVNRKRERAN